MADSVRWKRVSDAQWNAESIVDGKILFNYDKKFISLDQGTTRVKYYSFEEDNIANTYSSSSTYAVGDYVRYLDTLYRCNTAITVGEAFTASKWTSVIVMNEMSSLNTNLANIGNLTLLKTISSSTDTTTTAFDATLFRRVIIVLFAGGVAFTREVNTKLLTASLVSYQVGGTSYVNPTYYVSSALVYISKTGLQLSAVQGNNMTFTSVKIYGET